MKRIGSAFVRVFLILFGVGLLAIAWLWSQMPRAQADRVEAALDVVGVDTGGSFAWILRTPSGAALIDAGMDPDAQAILHELRSEGLTAAQVHTILLTHGHRDHWGGASKFPNAKVYLNADDLPLVQEGADPRGLARVVKLLSKETPPVPALTPLPNQPTITVDGVELAVVPIPGHSAGSVAYLHGDLLFVGDALLGKDRAVTPPFAAMSEDAHENLRSLAKLKDLPFTRMADGHTGVTADARSKLRRFLRAAR